MIAAVEGHAVAGGFELAIWCDLRVAARDAVFGVYCRRFGVPLVDGGTLRRPRLIGHSQAMDLILTGRGVSGEEALRMGLVNRLVEPGQALSAAVQIGQELARFPQVCLRSEVAAVPRGDAERDSAGNPGDRLPGDPAGGAALFCRGRRLPRPVRATGGKKKGNNILDTPFR